MPAVGGVEIIVRPNELKRKTVRASGRTVEQLVADGDRIVQQHAASYAGMLRQEVERIAALIELLEGPMEPPREVVREITKRAYHVKGVAGTFGYSLLTEIAGSLSSIAERTGFDAAGKRLAVAARVHVDAMRLALRTPNHQSLGREERELVASLRKLADGALTQRQ